MDDKEAERLICEIYREKMIEIGKESYQEQLDRLRENLIEGEKSGFTEVSYQPSSDPIVEIVVQRMRGRSKDGIEEYGADLTRDDLTPLDWLNEAQTEAIDFTLYLERIKRDYEIFKSIIRTTPNDQELGRKIRKVYGGIN